MELYIDRDVITNKLNVAQDIIASKTFRNILANVIIKISNNMLILRATDNSIMWETQFPVEGSADGVVSTFCDKITASFRAFPKGGIRIKTEKEDLLVARSEEKKVVFKIRTMPSEDYPQHPVESTKKYFTLPQAEFLEMIERVVFAVSTDETRYFLQGTYFEAREKELILVATDGKRLSISKKEKTAEAEDFRGVIIPIKVMNLVRKLCTGEGNIDILIDEGRIYFRFADNKLSSTLIEGTFPNYERVLPESQDFSCRVDRQEFLEAVNRVSVLTEKTRRMLVTITQDQLIVNSEESEYGSGEEQISISDYSGETMTFALNYVYLKDPLTVMLGKEVIIEFSDPNKVITIKEPDNEDNFHVIMPMRV